MVIVSNFEIQIVSAEDDCETPFKEHSLGSETYVEVEPDAEYYVSIRALSSSNERRGFVINVDGESLGYVSFVKTSSILCGMLSLSCGTETTTALKFVKADIETDEKKNTGVLDMGQIEVQVYEACEKPESAMQEVSLPPSVFFKNAYVSPETSIKKNIRSQKGALERRRSVGVCPFFRGDYLHSVVLKYCATPGLIAVGILPKPPFWEYNKLIRPSICAKYDEETINKYILSTTHNRKGDAIIVIKDDESDEDDDDIIFPKRKKVKHEGAEVCASE